MNLLYSFQLKGKQKLDITTSYQENKDRISKLKQDKDLLAFNLASSEKKDTTISQLFNNIKKVKLNIEQHVCHNCDLKYEHLNMFNTLTTLEYYIFFFLSF